MILDFCKMHGLGNDFLVTEQISHRTRFNPELIRALANRRTGVGFDQLLVIDHPTRRDIDFNYQIFNADGSEVENCGNGVRCLARFVYEQKLTGKNHIAVATNNIDMKLDLIRPDWVRVDMGAPILEHAQIPLNTEELNPTDKPNTFKANISEIGEVSFTASSLGNPHATIVVEDIDTAPVKEWGAIIESSLIFPNKVNVGFMQIISPEKIKLRVFERGAGETQACGTGACAAVVAGRLIEQLGSKVEVSLPGGNLEIQWDKQGSVFMTGSATQVYKGKIDLQGLLNS